MVKEVAFKGKLKETKQLRVKMINQSMKYKEGKKENDRSFVGTQEAVLSITYRS